jgi:hypothetical protein
VLSVQKYPIFQLRSAEMGLPHRHDARNPIYLASISRTTPKINSLLDTMRKGIIPPESFETVRQSKARIFPGCILALFSCYLFQGSSAIAQPQQPEGHPEAGSGQETAPPPPVDRSPRSTVPDQSEAKPKEKKEKRGSIVAAPLPISSPAIGSGIIPVLGYISPSA